jgi:hypothetical protein
LAGGLNLYGFANGDPVNFSDPFGLRADTTGRARRRIAAAFGIALAIPGPLDDALVGLGVTGFVLYNTFFAKDAGEDATLDGDEERVDTRDLSKGELHDLERLIKDDGVPSIEHLKSPGGKGAGKLQVRVNKKTGDIVVGPRKGPGEHEPTGYNIRDLGGRR